MFGTGLLSCSELPKRVDLAQTPERLPLVAELSVLEFRSIKTASSAPVKAQITV